MTESSEFVRVPETRLPCGEVVPAFEVSRYLCCFDTDWRVPHAASWPHAVPAVRINYRRALEACRNSGWDLITERQWLAIADDVASVDANWTRGQFGEGNLRQGLRHGHTNGPVCGLFLTETEDESRQKKLSNGQRIYDFGGNAWSWVFDDLQGGPDGVAAIIEEDSPSLIAPFPPMSKGMGRFPKHRQSWDGRGLIRGGGWRSGKDAGAFALYAAQLYGEYLSIGFRATRPITGDEA